MKGHTKTGCKQTHHKKTAKAYFVHILRIEKQIGDAQVFAKVSGNHGKQDNPTQDQYMVAPEIV